MIVVLIEVTQTIPIEVTPLIVVMIVVTVSEAGEMQVQFVCFSILMEAVNTDEDVDIYTTFRAESVTGETLGAVRGAVEASEEEEATPTTVLVLVEAGLTGENRKQLTSAIKNFSTNTDT